MSAGHRIVPGGPRGGYEIRFDRIAGAPLRLGLVGWLLSLALAYSLAGVPAALGVIISGVLTGSAMSTTALGTLIPVLRDAHQLARPPAAVTPALAEAGRPRG